MRRTVALLAVGLVLSACSSTVEGRARTAVPTVPQTASTSVPPLPEPYGTIADPTAPTGADPTGADPTGADPTGAASMNAQPTTASPTSPAPATPTGDGPTADDPTAEPPPEAQLPAGFYAAAGGELAYRPMSTDEFDCTPDQVSGCFGIMVFSEPGCAVGAGVTVGIFDKARDPDNPIGSASGTTPPILPGGSESVVIADSTGVVANLTARVQQVVC